MSSIPGEVHIVAAIPSIQYAPVVRSLLAGRWDYQDAGTLDRTHLRFFTKATMVEMFAEDFDVVSCTGVNSVWAYAWAHKTLKRRAFVRVLPDSQWLHFVVVATPKS